jgi:MFS family permease
MTSTPGYSSARLTLLEILDRTFRLYRQNFALFIGIAALIVIPFTVVQQFITQSIPANVDYPYRTNAVSDALCGSVLITLILTVTQSVLTIGSLTSAASEAYMGHRLTIREAFDGAFKRFGALLLGLFAIYAILVAFLIFAGVTAATCVPGLAFGIALVVFVAMTTYSLMGPVLTLENVGPFLGINRAWSLGKARFWTAIGLMLILTIIAWVLALAFGTLIGWIGTGMRPSDLQGLLFATNAVLSVFLTPLVPIAQTIFYYDTRNRLEGLDFALQSLNRPDARPFDLEAPRPQSSLTSRDLINIAILTVAGLIVAVAANTLLKSLFDTILRTGRF